MLFIILDENLKQYLNTISNSCMEVLSSNSKSVNNVASIFSWILKALSMRGHPDASIWIDKVLHCMITVPHIFNVLFLVA